jgi:hypothetical protein
MPSAAAATPANSNPFLRFDLSNVLYLMFRLFPIILPAFFILSSIFSMDMKGLIYLAGLMFSVILTILTANTLKKGGLFDISTANAIYKYNEDNKWRCEIISLTKEKTPFSPYAPLSQVVYSYTLAYFLYIIGEYGLWTQNVITIILFGLLVIVDWVWNVYNGCNTIAGVFVAFAMGAITGLLWAFLIDKSGAVRLQYFSGLSNRTVCTRPSSQTFKCADNRQA